MSNEPGQRTTMPSAQRSPRVALLAIILIAIASVALSALSARTKSATFDEPVHLLSSWLIVNHADYRVNPEHPPLWKLVAGLPLIGTSIDLYLNSPEAMAVLGQIENQGPLATDTLFRPGKRGPELLSRARLMMSLFLLATILVAARWAWRAGGPVAALIATALLALDPNFLAHGTLVTNDVAASLIFVAAGYLTWRLGSEWRWKTAALLALTCAAGAGIKFTCILLAPIVGLPLILRALASSGHDDSRFARTRSGRVALVASTALATVAITAVGLWALYGFRFAPTPSGAMFDADYPRRYLAYNAILKEQLDADAPSDHESIRAAVPAYVPGATMRLIYGMQDRELLPQALGYGLTYAAGRGILRPAFLLGDYSDTGFALYFPVAVATKTPLVTLAVLLTTAILGLTWRRQWLRDPSRRWLVVCLMSCPVIYLTFAATSNLNIGIRHILPIYPAMYVAAGIALAHLIRLTRPARFVVPAGLALLALETLAATPNHLAFFNRAAGGERGGLRILGDSNLDWGQDLPALADWYRSWRAGHPDDAFYLAYFGSVDPAFYGIDYVNMSPGFVYDRRPHTLTLDRAGVVAISATWLQGTFPPELRPVMASLRARRPVGVINGSIYLYEFKPTGVK